MKKINLLMLLLLNFGLVEFNLLSEEALIINDVAPGVKYIQNLVDLLTSDSVSIRDSLDNMKQNCAKIRSEISSGSNDYNLGIELGCERLVNIIEYFAKTVKPNFTSVAKLPSELEKLKEELLGQKADKRNLNLNGSFYSEMESTFKNVHKRSNMNKLDLANLLIKKIKDFQAGK